MEKKIIDFTTYLENYPDENGFFGQYGGSFIPQELTKAFDEINHAYQTICHSDEFIRELKEIRLHFQGRPTPIYHCKRLAKLTNGAQIYLKREDLNHTGAHKINHCMAEGLLAKYMGKKRLIAETGAGQHGVALATAAAYFGLECEIHMGEIDIQKQAPNVARMQILGAKIVTVTKGDKTLKEAVDSAFESYSTNYHDSIYCIGSAVGPHPFPLIVRDFQKIIGQEAREQFMMMTGRLPDVICAAVGGGSNSIGMFIPFLADPVEIIGVEPLGIGTNIGEHAATMAYGSIGVMHGFNSIMIKGDLDMPGSVYSIASGLDYPSVGPEHAFLKECQRINYVSITDDEALEAFHLLSRTEGIIPALESAHAVAYAMKLAKTKQDTDTILVNLSGRGDKDIDYIMSRYGLNHIAK